MKCITDFINRHFTKKQRQWIWFVALWCFGLIAAFTLGSLIRILMGL
ncbi:hypothetical protein [Methylophaga sp.]|jgi:hypothetical protein|nr:hypothetical protein [Methylophaga sp.]